MKKIFPILTLVLALFALTGCEEEASKTTHATNINSTEKPLKNPLKKASIEATPSRYKGKR